MAIDGKPAINTPRNAERELITTVNNIRERIQKLEAALVTLGGQAGQSSYVLSRSNASISNLQSQINQINSELIVLAAAISFSATLTFVAGEPLGIGYVVYPMSDTTVGLADSLDPLKVSAVIGVTETAANTGSNVTVRQFGIMEIPSAAFDIGRPVYLNIDGSLTQIPNYGAVALPIGIATSGTKIFVRPNWPAMLASFDPGYEDYLPITLRYFEDNAVLTVNGEPGPAVTLDAFDVGATVDPSLLSGVSGLNGTEILTVEDGGVPLQATTQQIANLATGGTTGLRGFTFNADTSSTADSDPGPGKLRWNNATQASATVLYFDNETTNGVDLTSFWANLATEGLLYLRQDNSEDRFQLWRWSAVVDGTGYHKLTVSLQAVGSQPVQDTRNVYCLFTESAAGGGPVVWNDIQLISELPQTSGLDGDEHVVVEKGSTFIRTSSLFLARLLTQFTNVFYRNQSVEPSDLTDAANIATNAALSNVFKVTLGGNRTLDNPTNLTDGMILNWVIRQDGAGGRTLAYGSKFKWPGGTAPVVTATANAVSFISACYDAGNDILIANFSLGHA